MYRINLRSGKTFHPAFLLVFLIAIVIKIVQYTILPAKYFFDSNTIMKIMRTTPDFVFASAGYTNAAVFSNAINIFRFSTLQQWSIFYALIFNIPLFLIAKKYVMKTYWNWIWLFGTFGLLNLYVFNLSKEIFQLCVFLAVYWVLQRKRHSKRSGGGAMFFCPPAYFSFVA
jgi:hypothetical protein